MALRQTVQEIFHANIDYQSAQQALNQAHSLQALSDDLYTDPIRFIYELIQNSDDAYDGQTMKNPLLRIAIIDRTYLIVANYAKAFDQNDIRGVCRVGSGTKRNDREKTGYKGLGFKAVFGQTNYVLVASKGEFFRFEENAREFQWNRRWGEDRPTWEASNGQTFAYPWQICPLWTEAKQLPKPVREWLFSQPEVVAHVIRIRNLEETRESLKALMQQPHVFMFLRRIRDIRISLESATETTFNVSRLKDGSIKISTPDNKAVSHWLLYSCKLKVPDEARVDPRMPEKLLQIKEIDMTLATKIDTNDRLVPARGSDNVLFAYLPTKISSYNLPILVNTQFLVNASREHIRIDSSWNQWLFSCIPLETFKWIQTLTKDAKWTDKAYDLLPNPIPVKDILADRYNKSCLSSLKSVTFLLGIDNRSLLLSEAVVDITLFSSPACIGHKLIRDFLVKTSSTVLRLPANPFVKNNHRLRNLGVTQFTWERCLAMLKSPDFCREFSAEQDINLIHYLFNHRDETQIPKHLHELPFLMDQFGILRRVEEIYFPSRFSNADWMMPDNVDAYVHPFVMHWLAAELQIKDWLRKLGIHEKTDLTFVDEHIIPRAESYITPENAMVTMTRLLFLFHNSLLSTQHWSQLRKLKLFTVGQTLVSAYQLYFSTSYLPYLPLDHLVLDHTLFVSPAYLDTAEGISVLQWKHFFQFLGVQETIALVPFDDSHHNELVAGYVSAQGSRLPNYAVIYGFKNRTTITLIEQTQMNYEFALHFWEHVLQRINVRSLSEGEMLISQRHIPVSSLPQWCVRTRECIPTTTHQLLPSGAVYSSRLAIIAGKYLPVFACDIPNVTKDLWQTFFGFKTELSLEDHFHLLQWIHASSLNYLIDDDEERRIQLIYKSLIDRLSGMDQPQRSRSRVNHAVFLLSTCDSNFMASNELAVSVDSNLVLPPQVAQLRLSNENGRHPDLRLFLDVMGVRAATMADLSLAKDINARYSRSLHTKLRNIQPYLFALAENRKLTNHSIDCDLEIFEADRVELFYDQRILISQVPLHSQNNQLYVRQPWNSDDTMAMLPQTLCKKFRLPAEFEAELKWLLMAESARVIDTHFQERRIPVQVDFGHADLMGVGGTREKFANLIDRDNAKLFSDLQVTSVMTAAELLMAGLEAQHSEWTGYVYHFTHLENAVQILSERKLKARSELTSSTFKDSAADAVIKATRTNAKSYARFYFRPLTPTQRCNENLGSSDLIERFGNKPMCPVPIFFRFDIRALLAMENLQWKVSLGNMASHRTEFDCTREIVEKFDFQYVYADSRTERGKYSCQHEFLVESQLDFDQLAVDGLALFCQDDHARSSLTSLLGQLHYSITINSHFFVGYNPRVLIQSSASNANRISVSIDSGTREEGHDSQLWIQIRSSNATNAITGDLSGVFERDNVLTIRGKQRITFVLQSNDISYAVYYEYCKQQWLIYTNHADAAFKPFDRRHDHSSESFSSSS